jgi:hypothetical protein
MTAWDDSIHIPLYADPTHVTAPEPLVAVLREGLDWGYAINETRGMDASSPIFRELVNEAVAKQIAHEEDQIRAWLRALIADPAGRKIIEELL